MNKKVEENNLEYLEHRRFNFGGYVGQSRALRQYAIELWGVEEVAGLTDEELETKFGNSGFVPMVVRLYDGTDEETIYLIQKDTLRYAKCLER